MIFYTIPGMFLRVDFEKAFDSVSWSFIHKTLDFFGFGTDIKRWISVFYQMYLHHLTYAEAAGKGTHYPPIYFFSVWRFLVDLYTKIRKLRVSQLTTKNIASGTCRRY